MVDNIKLMNVVTKEWLELDTVNTPTFVLESVDWGTVQSNNNSYKYVNQIGIIINSTTIETRDVEIVGWVISKSTGEMTQNKSFLNRFVTPLQNIEMHYKGYKIIFVPYSSIQYSNTFKENNEIVCKFKISGLCPYPLFMDEVSSKVSGAVVTPLFHFPLVITNNPNPPGGVVFGRKESSLILNVVNLGAVDTGMRIVFRARTGSVVNPKLINVNTQEFLKISKTLEKGEEVVVNTNTGEKKVVGYLNGNELNYFKYKTYDSVWLQLIVGDNLFRYDADTGLEDLEVNIYYDNKYYEVQQWN